ncbi:hypothetical protein O181_008166 [Austropuccinia psidii MF-1]|uniref:Uncharacterized protein n=1 Tax=Austropuccinia psidii MF-1 TaxID=1389203 RepID=A0A9Q3BM42_9BASI|nr:hypothetical protein [Austropuccinia psidii MF-1]
MSYSEKKALKNHSEASSWPKITETGEYSHMELIDYIDGLFIDVTSIPDYWITDRLNIAYRGHASVWYTEMKEIHGIRSWPWWKSQIIQKYSNDEESQTASTNYRRTRACSKMQIQPKCNLDDIENTFKHFKDKPRERVAEVAKEENSCDNCGSTDHDANNFPKSKKKVYAIEKVPEEEFPTEDSESDSMGDSIREQSVDDQDPREELIVGYQEETPLEVQDIKLEAGMPQDTENKNLCKNTKDAHTFLATTTKGMAYIHGTARQMTVCIDNDQHPLIIDSGAHCSIVARNYLDHHYPNWEKELLPIKAKNIKSASWKMTSSSML